jgi:spermidine synthase
VNVISDLTRDSLPDQQALVLGLGGGSVANMLSGNKFKVEAVELDTRMAEVAKQYFELSENVIVHIDDARHFVVGQKVKNVDRKKYKVIVLDAFIGEVNPHHLFTQEFFREIRELLTDDGTFFINGNGYWHGEVGKGMRSVCKTLIHSGFNAEVLPTQEEEDYRNLVFVATKCDGDRGEVSADALKDISMEDAVLLTDDKPQLELLNAEANRRWREGCMKYFLHSYYSRQDMLLFE